MFLRVSCVFLWIIPIIFYSRICSAELPLAYLALYSPGDPEYTDVIVRRVGDNLTLACELRGNPLPHRYFWNYVPSDNSTEEERTLKSEPRGPTLGSRHTLWDLQLTDTGHYVCSAPPYSATKYILVQARTNSICPAVDVFRLIVCPTLGSRHTLWDLQLTDTGHYVCSAPPYSATKYILVQARTNNNCARGALWCGHCVLGTYVCDGFPDCAAGEDEAPGLCLPHVCSRPDKLNCSTGRCISEAACCRAPAALCRQPACCIEHARYSRLEGWAEEYPPLFEDRHAPDEYGFIQSTIYTVTACALIFMIAVVLLVSAICKMHMKRAALRSYTQRPTQSHQQIAARQMHRFPPCYEASRLLEAERNAGASPPCPTNNSSPAHSPLRDPAQWRTDCADDESADGSANGFGLARLSSLFTSRYRQVATDCVDVELRAVRAASAASSPVRSTLAHYRSPTSTDLNTDYFLHQEISDCGRDLNYMATPVEFFRRTERPRPITLQLGRFQLSIPRLGRRRSSDRRPDTPNVAEINIDDLDFVRLNSNETYTLNGRTIRLLGADFENYPVLNETGVRPPPYTDAMRYKLYGPPPEYLSRDALNNERENIGTTVTEEQARRNIEMPPGYDELSANGNDNNGNNVITVIAVTENNDTQTNALNNNVTAISAVINDLPAIDDVNANGIDNGVSVATDNSVTSTKNSVEVTNNNEG